MKSLSVKLGVILIGLAIFGCAEVWGADWKPLSGYILSWYFKNISALFISNIVVIGIFLFFGFIIGRSSMKTKFIYALDSDKPAWVDSFLVIPVKDERQSDEPSFGLTKNNYDWLMGRSWKGFVINLGPWPFKYIEKIDKLVLFPEIIISVVIIIFSFITMVIFRSIFVDIFIAIIIIFTGMKLGEHVIKRKIICTYNQSWNLKTLQKKIPRAIDEYVGIPCPRLFGQYDLTFIFHSDHLSEFGHEIKWKFAKHEEQIRNLENFVKEIVGKALQSKGYEYNKEINLWIRPLK